MSDIEKSLEESGNAYAIDHRRRAALAEIDNAKFSWFHFKVILVASVGFFTDSYDIFAINIASTMLGDVYGHTGKLTSNQDLGIKVATPIGTFFGQLVFGWMADHVGRKRMYGVELMIIILGCFAQTLCGSGHAVNIVGTLIVWRAIMGFGIGGDYPLSAVISSEFATTKTRGRLMTAVFSAQGWGNLVACVVSLTIVQIYKHKILHDTDPLHPYHVDIMWRLLIGIGCIPACLALYFRLTIPETPRFTMDIERNVQAAAVDIENVVGQGGVHYDPDAPIERAQVPKASWADFYQHFSQWKNGKVLLGTAWSWFALDIAFYGLGLNSSIVLQVIGFGTAPGKNQHAVWQTLHNISVGNIILSVGGLLPGYYVSLLFIDSWGRKPIQLMGFTMLTAIFIAMGFGYDGLIDHHIAKRGFVALYCFANFFQNFGPNVTTFVVPGEVFPTRYRSTAHGISAASGKLGAIVSQVGFAKLENIHGPGKFIKHIMQIFAFFMFTGIFSTLLIPETKGKTLEELSGEDKDGPAQL